MVDIAIVKPKIYTGKTYMEDLAEKFRDETTAMLKKVAFDNKCSVEELKFTVSSDGMVNIQRMTPDEMIEMDAQRIIGKKIKAIREMKDL